jgi:hypothetical protein
MRIAGIPAGSGSADGVGESALFRMPSAIWGDGLYLYVCDTLNNTIRRVEPATGRASTFAGKPNARGYSDGVGTDARVNLPIGMWGDMTSLFVIDGFTVRRIDIATQVVSTLVSSIPYEGVWPGPLKPFRETAPTFTFWIHGASASLRALAVRSPCSPGPWQRADMPTESGPAPGFPTFKVYGAKEEPYSLLKQRWML